MDSAAVTKITITLASFASLIISAYLGIDSFVKIAIGLVLGSVWGFDLGSRFGPSPPPTSPPSNSG